MDVSVARTEFRSGDDTHPGGTFIVTGGGAAGDVVRTAARELGLDFAALSAAPTVATDGLRLPRVGLYKAWHSRVDDQGWTLWLMEQFDFPVDTLHDATIRAGDLSAYDAIILPNHPGGEILRGNAPGTMPDQYVGGIGSEGAAQLERFVKEGGTLIAFDASTDLPIDQFGLPVRNAVAGLPSEDFFIPGSLIRADVDTEHPLARGMQSEVAVAFSQSRAFEVVRLPRRGEGGAEPIPAAAEPPVEVVVRYSDHDLLMSGWAMGEDEHIAGRPALVTVGLGEGSVVLFGFRPQFRGQPRGTYKLLFNAIFDATVRTRRPIS